MSSLIPERNLPSPALSASNPVAHPSPPPLRSPAAPSSNLPARQLTHPHFYHTRPDGSVFGSPVIDPSHPGYASDGSMAGGAGGDGGRRGSSNWSAIGRRKPRKGMTMDDMQSFGFISSEEKSGQFEGLPISEAEIKKLPRKLRGYYSNLAILAEHYTEVDALLIGELPSTIATSFARPEHQRRKSYTRLMGDLTEDVMEDDMDRPHWTRRGSAWRVRRENGEGHTEGGGGEGDAGEEERTAGEGTPLLAVEREERRERIARFALNVNTIINILLVAVKAIAVLYSSSISLTASLVDSALDMLSTFIILGTSLAIGVQSDKHLYPAGKRRFEPLGVLIFSVAMIASFVQVFIESFERAIAPASEAPVDLSIIGMSTMLATIGIKAVLWIWCSRIESSGVQALAQDAENDVILNIMSLSFPFLGTQLGWRLLDPIGGMVLSTYIIVEWIKTLFENFANLSGKSASNDQLTRVLYLVSRFNPVIEIGDVECYHIGDDLIVEVDVILPQNTSLPFAHDVGETIQCMLESLDGVLRAYVHCDYSSANPSQHTTRTRHLEPAFKPIVESDEAQEGSPIADRPNGQPSTFVGSPGALEE